MSRGEKLAECSSHSLLRDHAGALGLLFFSCVQFFATPWTAACQASLSFTIFYSLFKLMSTESVMPSNGLVLCRLLLLACLHPFFFFFGAEGPSAGKLRGCQEGLHPCVAFLCPDLCAVACADDLLALGKKL